jgi:hypothetical protein
MQNIAAVGGWFDTGLLVAKSEALHATLAREIARSRELISRSRERRLDRYARFPFARRIAGGSELDGVHMIGAVLAKLLDGTLPTRSPSQVWASESKGEACHACDELIEPGEIECEVNITRFGSLRFHRKCFHTWDQQRAWYVARSNGRGERSADVA